MRRRMASMLRELASRTARRLPALVLLGALLGCGSAHEAQVSGKITLDGAPLTTGTVAFHPVGGGPVAYGVVDRQGKYQLQTGTTHGLAAGEYRVLVVATGELPTDSTDPYALPPLLTPP